MLSPAFTIRPNDSTSIHFTRVGLTYDVRTEVQGETISTVRLSTPETEQLVGQYTLHAA
ncbi:hypothetical protein [Streptomyces sp. NPDC007063]|uniref:hypothetical protein n=1 Tax=Streptomyces sp. NPDC007063 TaxID=3364772 RepID=UPI0036AFD9DE